MVGLVKYSQSLLKLLKLEDVQTDNRIFQLHSTFTSILLAFFSILVSSKQYFGEPIECEKANGLTEKMINTYCWILNTYTLNNVTTNGLQGLGADSQTSNISVQKYYQWISVIFAVQAMLFHFPKYLWKCWEGGRLALLAKDLGAPIITAPYTNTIKDRLIKYFLSEQDNINMNHNYYAIRFAVCEVLNLLNLIVQIFFLDEMLNNAFIGYGLVAFQSCLGCTNHMNELFPKMAKCHYKNFGPSGSDQILDTLCILPLNVVNEKIFLVLWFWFVMLLIFSILAIVHRFIFLLSTTARYYFLRAQVWHVRPTLAKAIANKFSFGDFFLLYQLGKNVNPVIFREFVVETAAILKKANTLNQSGFTTPPIEENEVEV